MAGIITKKVAAGGLRLLIKANLLMGAVMLWNMLAHRDEWEELGEAKRRQMHLIFGRREDGTIQTIRFQGAFPMHCHFSAWKIGRLILPMLPRAKPPSRINSSKPPRPWQPGRFKAFVRSPKCYLKV